MKQIKENLKILFVLTIVYVILFEFVLPPNGILPKPSLLIEAFTSLFADYQILDKLFITASAVYIGILIGFIMLFLTRGIICKLAFMINKDVLKINIFRYVPAFFYAVLFAFWFEASVIAEVIFAVIAVYFLLVKNYVKSIGKVKEEYITSAISLGYSEKRISNEIIWKASLPKIMSKLKTIHYYIWTGIIIYEFVGNNNGIGYIYNSIIEFEDLSALFGLAILLSVLVLIGVSALNSINKKIINWES